MYTTDSGYFIDPQYVIWDFIYAFLVTDWYFYYLGMSPLRRRIRPWGHIHIADSTPLVVAALAFAFDEHIVSNMRIQP